MNTAFVRLHTAIFIAGFTGILGRLIQLAEGPLVLYRMLLTTLMLLGYLLIRKKSLYLPLREALKISGVGALIALHWLFFYGSVKYANVSIAVVCFALVGFFTSIIEPIVGHRRISTREVCFSLITVLGVALIFHFDTRYRVGILLGVISALFAALFTIAMKWASRGHDGTIVLLYQMGGGFTFLALLAPFYLYLFPQASSMPTMQDVLYLSILSSVCTIGLFLLQIQVLRSVSAFTVNLSFNLEPVYSIALAMLIFNEAAEVNFSFFLGLLLICASVLLQTLYVMRQRGGV